MTELARFQAHHSGPSSPHAHRCGLHLKITAAALPRVVAHARPRVVTDARPEGGRPAPTRKPVRVVSSQQTPCSLLVPGLRLHPLWLTCPTGRFWATARPDLRGAAAWARTSAACPTGRFWPRARPGLPGVAASACTWEACRRARSWPRARPDRRDVAAWAGTSEACPKASTGAAWHARQRCRPALAGRLRPSTKSRSACRGAASPQCRGAGWRCACRWAARRRRTSGAGPAWRGTKRRPAFLSKRFDAVMSSQRVRNTRETPNNEPG